jgi:DNA-binding NarL/FixJ family response regulator
VRWFESRSTADLGAILVGVAFPVVLIDLARQPLDGLTALDLVRSRTPDARSLVLDPEAKPELRSLARELGATHVCSGFVPPPLVAELVDRWITKARHAIASAGWSRTTFPESALEPWSWLADHLLDPAGMTAAEPVLRQPARPALER